MKNCFISFVFLSLVIFVKAQNDSVDNRKLIQFSGVVVESVNLQQLPFTNIMIKNSNRGTVSDAYGYYSFVAQTNDTIMFSYVGFQDAFFIIPDTLSNNRYSLIQLLNQDTITLKETIIYPWPSREDFKEAFVNLNIGEDDFIRAQQNMARAAIYERSSNTPMSASENYNYQMQLQQSRLYYAGQFPSINLLNPIAWSKFVKAWKSGEFKKQ